MTSRCPRWGKRVTVRVGRGDWITQLSRDGPARYPAAPHLGVLLEALRPFETDNAHQEHELGPAQVWRRP